MCDVAKLESATYECAALQNLNMQMRDNGKIGFGTMR